MLTRSYVLALLASQTRAFPRQISTIPRPLRVITFDLDDTLWSTSEVIGAANRALTSHLLQNSPPHTPATPPPEIWKLMQSEYKVNPSPYSGADDPSGSSPAVQLTALRKVAISQYHTATNNPSPLSSFVTKSFSVWEDARHKACGIYQASNVVDTLNLLKAKNGKSLIIGAITNGNANVCKVEQLGELFDFSITSENIHFAKPSPRIFEAAIEMAKQFGNHEGDVNGWVHVGDDLAKDVQASKSLGMRTIWCKEFVDSRENEDKNDCNDCDYVVEKFSDIGSLEF